MSASHFTGPLIAGPILNTSGTTLGQDVADTGSVVLTQAQAITQVGTYSASTGFATSIVIPAYSLIHDITLYVTTGWTAGNISIGTSTTSTELVVATAPTAVGVSVQNPGTDATRTGKWISVGSSDVRIYVLSSTNATGGVATISVSYVQGFSAP
jgi:hypothetical protein